MASVPALTPLVPLSQQLEGMMNIVGLAPRKRLNPVVGLREAKQQGHQATFPEEKFLGVLSTSAVPSGCLATTNAEFAIILGTRQQRWLQVIKPMGSKRDRELRKGGHCTQQFCRKTAVVTLLKTSQ
jgi:hypothetical protein